MKTINNSFAITESGIVEGLFAIGFQGTAGPDDTPHRAEPVLADDKGRLAFPRGLTEGPSGARHLSVELQARANSAAALPGEATRFEPIPYRLSDLIIVLGDDDKEVAKTFLAAGYDRVRTAGDVTVWSCSEAEAWELFGALEKQATAAVIAAVSTGNNDELIADCAWRLSRCARGDEGLIMAIAALRRVAPDDAALLQREGSRDQASNGIEGRIVTAARALVADPLSQSRQHVRLPYYSSINLEASV